jgi:MFS family permease
MSSSFTNLSKPLLEPRKSEESSLNLNLIEESHALEIDSAVTRQAKSRNVHLVLAYTFFSFSARSLWNQSVLSAFVYLLKSDDPKYVGFITGMMGISQLVSSFPSGWLADKYRRDKMLKLGSAVGFCAAASTLVASRMNDFTALGVALSIWGLFWGICNTSVMALFADSIEDGDRSYYFMQRQIMQLSGNTFGPVVALYMFTRLGNEWSLNACSIVISGGQFFAIPSLLLLCFMNDDFCVQESEDTYRDSCHNEYHYDSDITASSSGHDHDTDEECGYECPNVDEDGCQTTQETIIEKQDFRGEPLSGFCCIPSNRVIPSLVALSDVLGGLAAGMSIRYFPIFFLDDLKLSPAQVQIVFIVSMTTVALMGRIAQLVGTKVGRIETTIICKCSGSLLLLAMTSAYKFKVSTLVVCTLYLLRTALVNAPGALTRSVLMDHVPKQERGKWSALESVNMFSWSGSAAIGGILVGMRGISFNFNFTAYVQLLATIPLMFLCGKVQREK